jgi:hypothetical protein
MLKLKASRSTGSTISNDSLYYMNAGENYLKPLTLIGILPANILQNWSSFDGNVKKFMQKHTQKKNS